MFGRQVARSFSRIGRKTLVFNSQRAAGGFNSKFKFEKPYNPKEGDVDPMYVYDPDFKNESTVCV